MIEVIPKKIESALIFFHSADNNSNQLEKYIDILKEKLPLTYILADDGPISGSPIVLDGTFYGNSKKRYWFMFPMKDACSQKSFIENKIAQGATLLTASAYLNRDIDRLSNKYNIPISKIVLCGFQHGSCLALSAAMIRKKDRFAKVILIQPYLLEALYLEKENRNPETEIICIENEFMRRKTFNWIGIYTEKEMQKLGLNTRSIVTQNGEEAITNEIVEAIIREVK